MGGKTTRKSRRGALFRPEHGGTAEHASSRQPGRRQPRPIIGRRIGFVAAWYLAARRVGRTVVEAALIARSHTAMSTFESRSEHGEHVQIAVLLHADSRRIPETVAAMAQRVWLRAGPAERVWLASSMCLLENVLGGEADARRAAINDLLDVAGWGAELARLGGAIAAAPVVEPTLGTALHKARQRFSSRIRKLDQ